MRIRALVFWISIIPVFIVAGCQNEQSGKTNTSADPVISPINPNGDSELALLMRAMFIEADSFRVLIANGEGNINEEFVEMIRESHEAIPTKPEMKPLEFEGFNQMLLNEAIALLESDSPSKDDFNSMVNRCMDCHHLVCPGPTRRIENLYIR